MKQICITGVGNTPEEKLQSLIEIETILVMALGDEVEDDEYWNNMFIEKPNIRYTILGCDNKFGYYSYDGLDNPPKFRADDLKSILEYLLD